MLLASFLPASPIAGVPVGAAGGVAAASGGGGDWGCSGLSWSGEVVEAAVIGTAERSLWRRRGVAGA
jgi:hypothetical protein